LYNTDYNMLMIYKKKSGSPAPAKWKPLLTRDEVVIKTDYMEANVNLMDTGVSYSKCPDTPIVGIRGLSKFPDKNTSISVEKNLATGNWRLRRGAVGGNDRRIYYTLIAFGIEN